MLAIELQRTWEGIGGRRIGPVDGLRFDGRSLRVLPLNVEILRLAGDRWMGENESFVGLVIESPTIIYVERSRRVRGHFHGPFDFVRILNTAIYTSMDMRQTFARFNYLDDDWHLCHNGENWPRLMLFPSADPII